MNNFGREYSPRQVQELDSFLEQNGLEMQIVSFTNGEIIFAGKPGEIESIINLFGREKLEEIVDYQKQEVTGDSNSSYSDARGDCKYVANAAIEKLFKKLFKSEVDEVNALSMDTPSETPSANTFVSGRLNFFNSAFRIHWVNFVKLKNGKCVSIDLTAHYTHFNLNPNSRVFCVIGENFNDLDAKLKTLFQPMTDSEWRKRKQNKI